MGQVALSYLLLKLFMYATEIFIAVGSHSICVHCLMLSYLSDLLPYITFSGYRHHVVNKIYFFSLMLVWLCVFIYVLLCIRAGIVMHYVEGADPGFGFGRDWQGVWETDV